MAAHPVIRVAPDVDFPPVEFLDGPNHFSGIAMDYLALLEKRLPVHFQIVHLKNWQEVMRQAKSWQIDMLSAATPTPERLQFMRFTSSLMEFPAVIVARSGADQPRYLKGLADMRVAVVAGYAASEYMREAHPEVTLVEVPDIVAGLRQVSFGKVDAMVLNLASATYYIAKEGIGNLEVYQDTDFIYDLSIGTRSDWPILVGILDKAVRSISPAERQEVLHRWIHLNTGKWHIPVWLQASLVAFLLTGLLVAIILWNHTLRKQVAMKTKALQRELLERHKAEKSKEELQRKIHRAKKMEALGLLAGGVAHDLNNILSGIVGYPDLLLKQLPEESPMRPMLLAIKDSGKRAARQVNDLLTIARGSASEKKPVNLVLLVEKYLASLEHQQLKNRFVNIHVTFDPPDHDVVLNGSVTHLEKTILNLVINGMEAIASADGEGGELTIAVRHESLVKPHQGFQQIAPGDYAVLSVRDSGAGIAAQDMENIFEPFYSKKKMGRSGTGLGLAIVWNTIEDHAGAIDIISGESGTEFRLYFPACTEKVADTGVEEQESLQGNGETVLVVDDEQQMRDIGQRFLSYLGYEVKCVASGEEAVAYLKENQVDLVLLDMLMEPGMNGRQTYEQILAIRPGQKAIIVSGFSESSDVLRTMALGAGQFIRKPYTLETIGRAVKQELADSFASFQR